MTSPEHMKYRNWTPPAAKVGRTIKHPVGWAVAVVLALVLSCLVGIAIGNGSADAPTARTAGRAPIVAASPSTVRPAVKATPHPSAGKPAVATTFGDGTWQVGRDVAAGTYVVTVPADSFGCYWARQKDASGDLSSISANDNVSAGAHATITIKGTDHYVKSQGCGTWVRR